MVVRGRESGIELRSLVEVGDRFGLAIGCGEQESDFIFHFSGFRVERSGPFESAQSGRGVSFRLVVAALAHPLGGGSAPAWRAHVIRAHNTMWRTHSCVPRRDSSRRLF